MGFKSDIEIAQECTMEYHQDCRKQVLMTSTWSSMVNIKQRSTITSEKKQTKKDGKLILVTAINPTPAGEGKTTTTVEGLADGMQKLGKNVMVALREPSLDRYSVSKVVRQAAAMHR